MSPLCPFKHIFGKEGTGVHSIRLFDIAVIDVLLTVVGAVALGYYFKWNVWITIAMAFIIGIIVHRVFCVNTKINMAIFGTV